MSVGMEVHGIQFSDTALIARPEHAAVLGRIFTSWSLIESLVAAELGVVMGGDHRAALAVINAYGSNHQRVEAVKSIARALLDETPYNEFAALMGRVKSYASQRNQVAHGLWGVKSSAPDSVFRLPMKAHYGFIVGALAMAHAGDIDAKVNSLASEIEERTIDDLRSLEIEGRNLHEALMRDYLARSQAAALAHASA